MKHDETRKVALSDKKGRVTRSGNADAGRRERPRGARPRRSGDAPENFVMQLARGFLERDSAERVAELEPSDGIEESALRKPGWFCRG